MPIRTTAFALGLLSSVTAFTMPLHGQSSIARYERAFGLQNRLQPLVLNLPSQPVWIGKTSRFWYSKTERQSLHCLFGGHAVPRPHAVPGGRATGHGTAAHCRPAVAASSRGNRHLGTRASVIESIYAGPQGSSVPKTFSAYSEMQAIAELGFIVVQIDGMGTSNRSKAFQDVAYRKLHDAGFPDRILWHRAAAAKYPYYDISNVGIYGGSAGGYSSTAGILHHPDFYKVAVSGNGNHDHRMDKISFNELFMGWPIGP